MRVRTLSAQPTFAALAAAPAPRAAAPAARAASARMAALVTTLLITLLAQPLITLVVPLLAAPAIAGGPLVGSGDIHFRFDSAQFRGAGGDTEFEFYFEVDNDELRFEPRGDRLLSRLRLRATYFADGKKAGSWSKEPELWVDSEAIALSPLHTQILQIRLSVKLGVDSLLAFVEDRNARKRGLFHVFAKTPRRGEVGQRIALRSFPERELSISDLEFAQSIQAAEPGAIFMKSGLDVEPNAGRVYGLPRGRVEAYYEVYDLRTPPPAGARRYRIRYQVRTAAGVEILSWQKRLGSSSPAWADTVGFNVDGFEPDSYVLSLMVTDEGSAARALIEGGFEVFRGAVDWVAWLEEQESTAHFFLQSHEFDAFLEFGMGHQERYLRDFWRSMDSDPAPGNPTREEFMRRIRFANERYSNNLQPGLQTDPGRVYIRYGEPDDIRQEIIPIQGNDLNAAIGQLERESGGHGLEGIRGIDDRGDNRAFEIWVYHQRGDQLFQLEGHMSSGLGMQFIFVDDLGTGQNFRLIRSTEPFDF